MKKKLTKKFVDSLSLPERKTKIIWDTELTNFGIRLYPSKKSYIVQARVNGKTRRVTLGEHGTLTVNQARERAKKELVKMIDGHDPSIEKKKQIISAMTLGEIAIDYMTNKKTSAGHHLKESTKKDIRKHLKGIFSDWAERPLAKISVEGVRSKFAEASKRSPAQSNQAFRILRAIYNYARSKSKVDGIPTLPENPVNVLSDPVNRQWNFVPSRTGQIPENRLGAAWKMIQIMRTEQKQTVISRSLADFVAFLLLTGARFNEAACLTWDRVNFDAETWFLPDAKNRKSVHFPLSSQAVSILKNRPRINEYVFFGHSKSGHVTDARHQMKKISDHIGYKVTAHDLRRTFRAAAAACGIELWRTKLLMNHAMKEDVTIRAYTETNNLYYLKSDVDTIGSFIERKALEFENQVVELSSVRKQA